MDAIQEALTNLETARHTQALKVAEEQTRLAQLDDMIQKLKSNIVVIDPALMPKRTEYAGLGIVEATERLLMELGTEKTTPEIAEELLQRGVTTKSERFTPTVYATLTNSNKFVRKGTGRSAVWALKKPTSRG